MLYPVESSAVWHRATLSQSEGAFMSEPTAPEPEDRTADQADMLADLDALLERMMALPVNQADEEGLPVRRSELPPADVPIITITEAVAHSEVPPAPPVSTTEDDLYFKAVLAAHS